MDDNPLSNAAWRVWLENQVPRLWERRHEEVWQPFGKEFGQLAHPHGTAWSKITAANP